MTYREQLNKVKALGIEIFDLKIACYLDDIFYGRHKLNEIDFELLCDYARDVYLEDDSLSEDCIALCIYDMLTDLGYTVYEVLKMEKRKFIADAKRYIGCTVDDVLKSIGQLKLKPDKVPSIMKESDEDRKERLRYAAV